MNARPLLALVLAGGLALAGCSTDAPRDQAGQVTASATADAFSLRVGDCTPSLTTGNVTELQLVPCDQEHAWEAFASKTLPEGDYPGDSDVSSAAEEFCVDAFKPFVGIAQSESTLDVNYLGPTKDSWANGDREVICLAGLDAGGLKGTLKDSKK